MPPIRKERTLETALTNILQTPEERVAMFMKLSKRELVAMLMANQDLVERWRPAPWVGPLPEPSLEFRNGKWWHMFNFRSNSPAEPQV